MQTNPLLKIKDLGQSIWLDYIQRELLTSGEFQQLIDDDGVCGVTSNPAILEKAITEHHDYDAAINAMPGSEANAVYERLAIEDLQQAADLLRPTYESTRGRDGFVSLEVSPLLTNDTEATVREARRLWTALNRPNSLIKIPATMAGLAAIRHVIADGINVNATLLFGLKRYQAVVQAYLSGLEIRAGRGKTLSSVTSVASFFLSRIDTLIDKKLDALETGTSPTKIRELRGQAAIASACLAYQLYKQQFDVDRWRRLAAAGATTQRLLWASTSAKDPAYSDIKYIEALIGSETINTMPLETIAAYRDHGQPAARLEQDIKTAQNTLAALGELGIDLDKITEQLENEGVQKFTAAFTVLIENLQQRIH